MKKFIVGFMSLFLFGMIVSPVNAHVTVKPNTANAAAYQVFTVSVPVEKDIPTTQVRIVIPDGLKSVTPNVKPGWQINLAREGEGEAAKVTEITWSGGNIPAGQRDEFLFSTQVPAEEGKLAWKAYQTYEDGSVVSWDQDPSKEEHSHGEERQEGPWSETQIVKEGAAIEAAVTEEERLVDQMPIVLSVAAILLAGASLWLQSRKKR
jgi:uncharacterized protein YcnI